MHFNQAPQGGAQGVEGEDIRPIGGATMGDRFWAIWRMQQVLIAEGPGFQPSHWWNPQRHQDPPTI